MTRNFYFRKIAEAVEGSANFASLISSSASTYGLTSAQATAFGLLNTALQTANTAASAPSTRTSVAVEARRNALKAMKDSAVLLARIVYATPTVTDQQLVALGLLPRPVYERRRVPDTKPVITVLKVDGRVVDIRLSAPDEEGRGMPPGAKCANIFTFVGDEPPTDERAYHFEGATNRARAQILFPNTVPSGATAWISACWVSDSGQIGIGSAPVSVTVQGGPVVAAA